MAIIAKNIYGDRVIDTDPDYPQGKAKNLVGTTKGTGTPLEENWVNDIWGFQQAVLDEAGITPSGVADKVGSSDTLEGIATIVGRKGIEKTYTLAEAVALTNIKEGDTVIISDRGNGLFEYKTGQTPNTFNIVACTGVPTLSLVLIKGDDGFVTLKSLGAGAGSDDSAAFQAALNLGGLVDTGEEGDVYIIDNKVQYTGKVHIKGKGTLTSDILFLELTDADDAVLEGFKVLPKTIPYTIKRDETWYKTAGDIQQSLEGYIPTSQCTDIWDSMPQSQKDHNAGISPAILLTVSTSAGAKAAVVQGLRGYQLSLIVQGYTDTTIQDNTFNFGLLTYGGITVINGINRNYNSSFLGFTLPRGDGNKIINNKGKYASICGIVMYGNDNFLISGNSIQHSGESNYKLAQFDEVPGPSESIDCVNTNGIVTNNYSALAFYDGLDMQVQYGISYRYIYGGTIISNNISEKCRHTGITTNASNCAVSANSVKDNGTHGIKVVGSNCTVVGNNAKDNLKTGSTLVTQPFDILVQGDDCVSAWNNISNPIAVPNYNYLHSGFLGADPTSSHEGTDLGNYCSEGAGRLFISPSIQATKNNLKVPSIEVNGSRLVNPVTSVGVTTYTVSIFDTALSFFTTGTCTVTLPNAADHAGRVLRLRNTNTQVIQSDAANVGQLTGGAPTNTLLPAISGSWIEIQSNGSEWIIMASS